MSTNCISKTSEFFKNVYIAFVAYGETAESTACWQGLRQCEQAGFSAEWIAFETGKQPTESVDFLDKISASREIIPGNPGLGICFNLAASKAKALGKTWLLLFDSDFSPSGTLLQSYYQAHFQFPKLSLIVPQVKHKDFRLSPYATRMGRYYSSKAPSPGILPTEPWFWINNGMLVRLDVFFQVGGFHARTIADFSDTLFCFRIRKAIKQLVLMPVIIEHRHSAFSRMNFDNAIARFKVFCLGSAVAGNEMGASRRYFFWAFLRALRLSLQFHSLIFFWIILKNEKIDTHA